MEQEKEQWLWNETCVQMINSSFRIQKLFLEASADGESRDLIFPAWTQRMLVFKQLVENLPVSTSESDKKIDLSLVSSEIVGALFCSMLDFIKDHDQAGKFFGQTFSGSTQALLDQTTTWLESESYLFYETINSGLEANHRATLLKRK